LRLDSIDADDLLWVIGAITWLDIAILDPVHVLHPLDDLSEHRMVAVEPGCGHGGEEELRAAGVRARVGHREQPGAVVALGQGGWLARNLPSRTSGTSRSAVRVPGARAASLDHEILDDTVEVLAVVEPVIDELEKVPSGLWTVFGVQSD